MNARPRFGLARVLALAGLIALMATVVGSWALDRGWLELPMTELVSRYRDRPMSLADACLVRLSELHRASTVFTLDSDFRIYRRHGNKVIPVLMPES